MDVDAIVNDCCLVVGSNCIHLPLDVIGYGDDFIVAVEDDRCFLGIGTQRIVVQMKYGRYFCLQYIAEDKALPVLDNQTIRLLATNLLHSPMTIEVHVEVVVEGGYSLAVESALDAVYDSMRMVEVKRGVFVSLR